MSETTRDTLPAELLSELRWDERGLVAAVCVDRSSGAVLMLAWMNQEALGRTLATGTATFFSRSRQALWVKGETSGNTLHVSEVRIDCDGDAVLLTVDADGPACHTGARSCFYRPLSGAGAGATVGDDDGGPAGAAAAVVDRVYRVLEARKAAGDGQKSYTASLLAAGWPTILAKIAEEHGELADELPAGADDKVVHETVDLLFHVMVGLVARGITPDALWRELERRFGTGGHAEKAARPRKEP